MFINRKLIIGIYADDLIIFGADLKNIDKVKRLPKK